MAQKKTKTKKRGATKKAQAEQRANQVNDKPSILLVATTIVSIVILIVFLMQLKPGKNTNPVQKPAGNTVAVKPKTEKRENKNPTSKTNKPTVAIKKEETKKVEDYDFYKILPKNNYNLTNDDLVKLDRERADAALRGEIPPPLPNVALQPPENKNIISKQKEPNSAQQIVAQNNVRQSTPQINLNESQNMPVIKSKPVTPTNPITPINTTQKDAVINNKIHYFWQAGSFQNKQDAEKMRAKLGVAGHIAEIETIKIKGETWHRVLVGPYADKAKLVVAQQKLTAQGFNELVIQQRQVK